MTEEAPDIVLVADLAAELYIRPEPDPIQHRAIFRCLLQLTPEAARQIPFVLGQP